MKRCCVRGCFNNTNNSRESFFRFPTDLPRLSLWIQNVGINDYKSFTPEQCHIRLRICSVHFKQECFANLQRNRLTRNAAPTLLMTNNLIFRSDDELNNSLGRNEEITTEDVTRFLDEHYPKNFSSFMKNQLALMDKSSKAVPCYKESLDEGDNVVEEIILKYSDSDEEQHKYEIVDINKIKRESLKDDSETYKDSVAEIERLREEIVHLKRKTEEQEETICKMKLLNGSLARDLHNERHRNLYYKNKVNLLESEKTLAVSQRSRVGSAQDQIFLIVTNEESDKLS